MSSAKYIIYGLVDPISRELRYIGKSSTGLQRARCHLIPSRLRLDDTYKARWIKKCIADGARPLILTLEETSKDLLDEAEIFWIEYMKSIGSPLTNLTTGGDGAPWSVATRKKTMASRRGSERGKQQRLRLRRPLIATHKVTGEVRWYLSSYHAAKDLNGSQGMVSNAAARRGRWKSYKGFTFDFVHNFTNS